MVLFLMLFSACSTKKDAMMNRWFHQTTARYNGYFNGKESMRMALKKLDKELSDDYTEILTPVKLPLDAQAPQLYPELDRAIEKATKVIQNHSMKIRGREKNKWIDDNYLLIGMARFYKKEFSDALKTFDYVNRMFRKEESAVIAKIWATRCHIEMGNYSNARAYLTDLRKNRRLPEKMREHLYTLEAQVALADGDYQGAYRNMKSALDYTKKKKRQVRYMFIMAQISQEMEEYTRASVMYKKLLKKNPPYEMEFYARINRATSFDVYSGRSGQMKRDLEKMTEEGKYEDYLDQIYYAIADIYLREENLRKGREYLTMAAQASGGNTDLKTKIYLRLADIYFDDRSYNKAQNYYDSTLTVMGKNHPRREEVDFRAKDLKELVTYLQTIHQTDSVLRIASLKPEDRNAFIDRLIAQQRREDKAKAEAEKQAMIDKMQANAGNATSNTGPGSGPGGFAAPGGGWYFYNPQAISLGFSEFQAKWGNRKLEDHWRRKNKTPSGNFGNDNSAGANDVEGDGINDRYSRENYLSQLPITEEAQAEAHARVIEAYYKAGLVYKDKLRDYTSSIKNYQAMLKDYPETDYLANVYFALYRLNLLIGVKSEANKYKQLLLAQFPESEFANYARNANEEGELLKQIEEVQTLYKETYSQFKAGNHPVVLSNSEQAKQKSPQHNLIPKFDFLAAISKGKMYGQTEMQLSLRNFVNSYPNHELKPQAQALLDKLNSSGNDSLVVNQPLPDSVAAGEPEIEGNFPYEEVEEGPFSFVMVVPNKLVKMNLLKTEVSNFGSVYFSLLNLSVKSFFLNSEYQLLVVSGLEGKEEALKYYQAIKENPSVLEQLAGAPTEQFVISQSNFGQFYSTKDVGGYLLFFNTIILKNE